MNELFIFEWKALGLSYVTESNLFQWERGLWMIIIFRSNINTFDFQRLEASQTFLIYRGTEILNYKDNLNVSCWLNMEMFEIFYVLEMTKQQLQRQAIKLRSKKCSVARIRLVDTTYILVIWVHTHTLN